MTSEIKADKWSPASGTAGTIGDSGDTFTVPTGVGLTVTDEVKTNKISPASGTAFTLGDSGDTFTVPSGVTFANSGTATGFGGDNTPIFRAYQNSAQSISNQSYTVVNFQAENFDPDSTFNVSNNRFTPAVAGYYFIHAGIRIDTSTDMVTLSCNIRKNAGAIIRHTSVSQNYGNSQASILVYSDTDDYFDVEVYHDAGGSQNLSANSDDTFFEAFKVIT